MFSMHLKSGAQVCGVVRVMTLQALYRCSAQTGPPFERRAIPYSRFHAQLLRVNAIDVRPSSLMFRAL